MKKLLLSLVVAATCLTAQAGTVEEVLTVGNFTKVTGTSYTLDSYTSTKTGITYAGQLANYDNGKAMQFRSKAGDNGHSGLVITKNEKNYKITSITVTVNKGTNTWEIYGKKEAFTSQEDLYDTATKGTKIGSNSKTATITSSDGYTFIGFRSNNNALYITSIAITYDDGQGESGLKSAGLSFNPTTFSVNVGETLAGPALTTAEGFDGKVVYTSGDERIATVDAETGEVKGVAAGTTTISAKSDATATFDKGSASYTLTVIDPNAPGATIDNPMTVEQALAACADAPKGVYVKGIVTKIENWTANGGKYYIADAEGAEKLYVYNGQWGADAAGKPADGIISEGATVIVKGNLKIFGSNKIKEFDSNSQLVSYTAPVGPVLLPAGLEFSAAEHTVNVGETVDGLALTKPEDNTGVVTYTSSNDAIATVNAVTGAVTGVAAGTVTITATSTETDTYKAGEAFYTLTVVDPNAPTSASVDLVFKCGQSQGNQIGQSDMTTIDKMIASESQSLVASLSGASNLFGGVNKSVRFGSYSKKGSYKQGALTITLKEAYKITSIDVTITTYKSKNAPKDPVWNLDINGHQMVETLTSEVKTATTYNIPFETVALADESAAKTLTIKSTNAPVDVYSLKINYEPTSTGVNDIIADDANAPVEYYNLQGVRVANPESGLYIRVQGKKATKVLVK